MSWIRFGLEFLCGTAWVYALVIAPAMNARRNSKKQSI